MMHDSVLPDSSRDRVAISTQLRSNGESFFDQAVTEGLLSCRERGLADITQSFPAASRAISALAQVLLERMSETARSRLHLPLALQLWIYEAAHHGVSLNELLQTVLAIYAALEKEVVRAARAADVPSASLSDALIAFNHDFSELSGLICGEFSTASAKSSSTTDGAVQLVNRVLDGHQPNGWKFKYVLDDWHMAGVASADERKAFSHVAQRFDLALMYVSPHAGSWWFWLGSRTQPCPQEVFKALVASKHPDSFLAVGQPASRLRGWRRSHDQAMQAMAIAIESPAKSAEYCKVAILACACSDPLLCRSLQEMFMEPLQMGPEGPDLYATLRAYFEVGRNQASAAAVIGITRQAVGYRLRLVEQRLGRSIAESGYAIEVALLLHDLRTPSACLEQAVV